MSDPHNDWLADITLGMLIVWLLGMLELIDRLYAP